MYKSELGKLLGNHVDGVYVNADQSELYLKRKYSGGIRITTSADCCSETWFADITSPENLVGEIKGVRVLDLPKPTDDRSRQEDDEAYGFVLSTDKGDCTIVYRNSSNGYYGGSIGTVTDSELPEELTLITSDWSA